MSKKNKLMIVWVTVLGILLIGATFASWLVSRKQTTFNTINSSCINISFTSGSGTISFENTAPITDAQGLAQTGYTFTIRNNCNTAMPYQLNLDIFNVANQTNLSTSEIKLAIDNYVPRKVVYFDDTAKGDSNASSAKNLISGKIAAKSSETHTVKMWVDENTTTQNAVFSNRLFVMASPNLTVPEVAAEDCFVMNNDEPSVVDYYLSARSDCPNNVIVPSSINGTSIERLGNRSFIDANVLTWYHSDTDMVDVIVLDEENYSIISNTITYLFDTSIADNGHIGESNTANYTIYRFSEYPNWDSYLEEHSYGYLTHDLIDGGGATEFKTFNIPLDYDLQDLYDQFADKDIDIISANPRGNRSLASTSPEDVPHYLESLDLSRCTSLEEIESYTALNNLNLTKVEFPNNQTFPSLTAFTFQSYAFAYNHINQVFLPTKTGLVGNAFTNNAITHLELYSTEDLKLQANAFRNNQIASLEVNSTITFNGSVSNTNKPFKDNPLTAAGITIGHNSTNTVSDFINVE